MSVMSRCYTARVDKDYKMIYLDIFNTIMFAVMHFWGVHKYGTSTVYTVRATKYLAPTCMLNLKRVSAQVRGAIRRVASFVRFLQ